MGRSHMRGPKLLAAAMIGLLTGAISQRADAQIQNAGVTVDAAGVLRTQLFPDPTGQLHRERIEAAKAALDHKVATPSKLRKVSLTRLEEAIKDRLADGKRPTDEMLYLAGLTRVEYVFCFPETKDVVLAGPAEGWAADLAGRVCGIQTGRPVVELQDVVTALRAFAPGSKGAAVIGCSIDPTKEGLAQMQEYIRRAPPNGSPADTERFVAGMREALGLQTVHVMGVPATTHFAQVLVEADYRMKLIGIGLERPPINMKNYVDRANPASVSRNALQRWYFVPDYQCVRVSDDDLAMQIVGEGVKLVGADEVVGAGGARQQSSIVDRASKAFTEEFTKKYAQLAAVAPVYAQLRNLIDLSVIAAFIQQHDYHAKAGWKAATFGNESAVAVETSTAPQQVETAINAVWKGTHLMTPIGGGVHIDAHQAIQSSNLLKDDNGKLSQAREKTDVKNLAKGQWWWD